VKPFIYEPCANFSTSDHKPIRGAFTLITNSPREISMCLTQNKSSSLRLLVGAAPMLQQFPSSIRNLFQDNTNSVFHIFISKISCTNLNMPSSISPINPYILFRTTPDEYFTKGKQSTTKKLFNHSYRQKQKLPPGFETEGGHLNTRSIKSPNPNWESDEFRIMIKASLEDMERTGAMLHITVLNTETAKPDCHIGTVRLNLSEICSFDSSTGGRKLDRSTSSRRSRFNPSRRRSSLLGKVQRRSSTDLSAEDSLRDIMGDQTVDEPITKYGQINGFLQCKVQAMCFSNNEFDTSLPTLDTDFLQDKKKTQSSRKKNEQAGRRAGLYRGSSQRL